MSDTIHFRTAMFDVSKEELNPINPAFGTSALLWLKDTLSEEAVMTDPEPEDWGWFSDLHWKGSKYLIGSRVDYEPGEDPHAEMEWILSIEKHRSLKDKLFGRNKMSNSDECLAFLKKQLLTCPEVRKIECV